MSGVITRYADAWKRGNIVDHMVDRAWSNPLTEPLP